ncbi:MAG TPA: hypothetical protein VFU04_02540 [Solirubrobacterales bacterium]|nr:hypothetical protein [Solirubrobacterales bacterium]
MTMWRIFHLFLAAIAASIVAAGCGDDGDNADREATPFEPQATLTAIGGTERTAKPEIVLRVEARPGDANIRSAKLTLPAAFIVDSEALSRLCSERELEVKRCAGRQPMGSARVVSPAYSKPLSGPVYAVTGSGGLPRLAFVLRGPVELLLRGRIAVQGVRLQASVEDVPNTPLESFELRLSGGPNGYLVLSRDVCGAPVSGDVSFVSQEGETLDRRLPLQADCGS